MNLKDISLAARIQSADLARGVDWAHPSSRPGCRPSPRLRGIIVGTTLVLTSLFSTVAHAGPLADAMAAALGRPVAAPHGRLQPAPVTPAKQWVCGPWTDLWQGFGKGRTCEWR